MFPPNPAKVKLAHRHPFAFSQAVSKGVGQAEGEARAVPEHSKLTVVCPVKNSSPDLTRYAVGKGVADFRSDDPAPVGQVLEPQSLEVGTGIRLVAQTQNRTQCPIRHLSRICSEVLDQPLESGSRAAVKRILAAENTLKAGIVGFGVGAALSPVNV